MRSTIKRTKAFRSQLPSLLRLTVLADDRKVSTDSPVSRKLAWALENVQLRNLYEREGRKGPSALQPALDGFRNWATKRALEGSNLGQRDVNAVYVDLLKRLSRTDEHQEPLSELLERISGQGTRSSMFSRFGLSSEVDVHSIIEAITGSKPSRQQVMAQVVRPYMDSNEARFAALDPLRRILATFVDELNSRFLRNKRVSFDLARGVTIESGGQALDLRSCPPARSSCSCFLQCSSGKRPRINLHHERTRVVAERRLATTPH